MRSTIPLLSLASLGLNILSVQSAAVPNAGLARRAVEPIARVYLPDLQVKREAYEDGVYPPDTKKREAKEDGAYPPDSK